VCKVDASRFQFPAMNNLSASSSTTNGTCRPSDCRETSERIDLITIPKSSCGVAICFNSEVVMACPD